MFRILTTDDTKKTQRKNCGSEMINYMSYSNFNATDRLSLRGRMTKQSLKSLAVTGSHEIASSTNWRIRNDKMELISHSKSEGL